MVNKQVCIAPYLPREGPETVTSVHVVFKFFFSIDTYQPREGPETFQGIGLLKLVLSV